MTDHPARYLVTIEDRLKEVEGRLSSLEDRGHTIAPHSTAVAATVAASSSLNNGASRDTAHPETAYVQDDSADDAETIEDPIDGMGAVTFAEEEDCAFFGPSSNIAFLRNVSRAVARLTNDSEPWRPSPAERNSVGYTGGFVNASRPASPAPAHHDHAHEKIDIYAVPTDSVARELLAWYFSNTGVLFPYLHEHSFMTTFNQASKDKFRGVRRSWLALFNMVLAHAAVHARDISTTPGSADSSTFRADAESEMYYKRAYGLFNEKPQNRAGASVELGKLLLTHETSTIKANQGQLYSSFSWASISKGHRNPSKLGVCMEWLCELRSRSVYTQVIWQECSLLSSRKSESGPGSAASCLTAH